MMKLRSPNSAIHRSGNLLCGNLSDKAQSVNRSSLEYLPAPQLPESNRVGARNFPPSTPSSMVLISAPDGNFQLFHPTDPMATGYYPLHIPVYTSGQPRFSGYHLTADGGFVADAYDLFTAASQSLPDNATDFVGMFPETLVAPQPPIPPATPEKSYSTNSAFQYHPCRWLGGPQCDGLAPGRNREMGEHLRVFHHFIGHERDLVQCEWENCGQSMQRMNVPRHIVSRHLLAAASCRFCGKRFSRPDVVARHERTCNSVFPVASSSAARI